MSELVEQPSEVSPRRGSDKVISESKPDVPSNRSDARVRRIPKSQIKLSRRNFLKILAGGVLASVADLGIRKIRSEQEAGEGQKDRQGEAVFVPIEGDAVTEHREIFGFQSEATKRFIHEQSLPPAFYGMFAAAGVTFMSIVDEGDAYFIYEGSGGLAKYKGGYYLVTTMHVLDEALSIRTRDKTKLTVNIPGLEHMYLCKPREIYTFNPHPSPEYDSPVFIKLDEQLAKKVEELTRKGELHPLQPLPLEEDLNQQIALFRFQGGRNGLHHYVMQYSEYEANVDLYNISSDAASSCPGVSGSVGLEVKDGEPTGVFLGLFTHLSSRIYGTEMTDLAPDPHGVLGGGNTCSRAAGFTSFGKEFFSWGMTKTELP